MKIELHGINNTYPLICERGILSSCSSYFDKNKKVSLKQGQKAFKQLRKEAKKNGLQDMSLDEINAEIKAYRQERRAALAVAEGK